MSFIRRNDDSDVYVFVTSKDLFECNFCNLTGEQMEHFECKTVDEMLKHLRDHQAVGDQVPPRAFENLRAYRDGVGKATH